MSLADRLGRKEESIVLSIWVVHSESFHGGTRTFFAEAVVVKSVTHVSSPVFLVNLLGDRPCSGLLELALSLVKLAENGKVMKDLSPGTQCPRESGMATT